MASTMKGGPKIVAVRWIVNTNEGQPQKCIAPDTVVFNIFPDGSKQPHSQKSQLGMATDVVHVEMLVNPEWKKKINN